jgi:hypothetical protein
LYKGGTKEARKRFLDSLDAIAETLTLYDIVTPEKTYLGVNVVRVENSRRGARGAYFLSEVDVYFREVRTITATYTNNSSLTIQAIDPDALPPVNTGAVQALEVPPSVTKAIEAAP